MHLDRGKLNWNCRQIQINQIQTVEIYRQRPIVLHIAGKCKVATFGLWKKSKEREITLQISRKGEIYWELPANTLDRGKLHGKSWANPN